MLRWFKWRKKEPKVPFVCPHKDPITGTQDRLCRKWGCPDDPDWKGDGCA